MTSDPGRILRARNGFTLVEMMVVMVLLTFLLSLIATTLWSTIRIERTDSAAFLKTMRHSTLGDQFRADVADAVAAPAKLAEHVAGPECLILAHAGGVHVIYSWKDNRLERIELAEAGTHRRPMPVGEDWKIEFSRHEKNAALMILRLIDMRRGTPLKHPVEFWAALGGDVK